MDSAAKTEDAQPSLAPASAEQPAQRPGWRLAALRLLWVALLVAADLGSKAAVMPWLEARMPQFREVYQPEAVPALERDHHGHLRHLLVGDSVALMHNLNYGAAFGQLDSIPWVLVVGRAIAAVVLTLMVVRAAPGGGLGLVALVLVLAGCLGNLWDNLTYAPLQPLDGMPFGPVRDFIDVYFAWWDWHFPTFNIADSAITVGAVLLFLGGARKEPADAA
jgi:signal peptidase II